MVLDFGRLLLINLTLRMLLRVNQLETNRTLVVNRLGLLTGTGQFAGAGLLPRGQDHLGHPRLASPASPLQVHVRATGSGPTVVTQPGRGLPLALYSACVLCSLTASGCSRAPASAESRRWRLTVARRGEAGQLRTALPGQPHAGNQAAIQNARACVTGCVMAK